MKQQKKCNEKPAKNKTKILTSCTDRLELRLLLLLLLRLRLLEVIGSEAVRLHIVGDKAAGRWPGVVDLCALIRMRILSAHLLAQRLQLIAYV